MAKLSSFVGDVFVKLAYLFGISVIGTFIYSVIVEDLSGVFASIFFLGFFIVTYGRRIIKFKNINFDEEYIYIDGFDKISFCKVKEVGEKTIKFFLNNKIHTVYFNYYFLPSRNIRTLKKNIEKFKSKNEPC